MKPNAAVAAALLSVLLSGCTQSAPTQAAEQVVHSGITKTTTTGNPPIDYIGYLSGLVVDDTYRPMEGAVVTLPGLNIARTTDRNGTFTVGNLLPGPYLVRVNATGYRTAESVIRILEDEITRAKFILEWIAPPTPYHTTTAFKGFAEVTSPDAAIGLLSWCGECTYELVPERGGLRTLLIEAAMDPYGGPDAPVGTNRFEFMVWVQGTGTASNPEWSVQDSAPNPMRVDLPAAGIVEGTINLRVEPASTTMPEMSKQFEVFVTAFYHAVPPEGWSFAAGDA